MVIYFIPGAKKIVFEAIYGLLTLEGKPNSTREYKYNIETLS